MYSISSTYSWNENTEICILCSPKLTILLCIQIVQKEQIYKQMKTVIEMENSGVSHMLKYNKIEGLFRF